QFAATIRASVFALLAAPSAKRAFIRANIGLVTVSQFLATNLAFFLHLQRHFFHLPRRSCPASTYPLHSYVSLCRKILTLWTLDHDSRVSGESDLVALRSHHASRRSRFHQGRSPRGSRQT